MQCVNDEKLVLVLREGHEESYRSRFICAIVQIAQGRGGGPVKNRALLYPVEPFRACFVGLQHAVCTERAVSSPRTCSWALAGAEDS